MSISVIESGYKVTGGIYIVPNPAFDNIEFTSESQDEQKLFCELNGINYKDSILWIEIRAYDIDSLSSMFNDYGRQSILISEGIYLERFPLYLPETLLNKVEEGGQLSFKAEMDEIDCTSEGEPTRRPVIADFVLKAMQSKSKFARFGHFEDAIRCVIKKRQKMSLSEPAEIKEIENS
jgi:hypothetical protein